MVLTLKTLRRLYDWSVGLKKPIQSVAVAVDFPDIMIDKGQFFGAKEENPKPLRLYLGGSFYIPEIGMVIGRPTPTKVTKILRISGVSIRSICSIRWLLLQSWLMRLRMKYFLRRILDKLLGKAF